MKSSISSGRYKMLVLVFDGSMLLEGIVVKERRFAVVYYCEKNG